MDARAWMVAHLMLATGNLPRGTRLEPLMRQLLGRAPGEGADATDRETAESDEQAGRLSAEASVTYMKSWVRAREGRA